VRTVVVYVHGLWLNGWESLLLRQRLSRELDCNALSFRYSSMGAGLRANALSLAAFLTRLHADTLHLVGHSMGGAVILELFEGALDGGDAAARSAMLPPGRIVLLGSPLRGSRAARNLSRWPLGRRLLGPTAHEVLLPELSRRWVAPRELGVIAGDVPLGLGRVMGRFGSRRDGTFDPPHDAQWDDVLCDRRASGGLVLASRALRHQSRANLGLESRRWQLSYGETPRHRSSG
jgi:pimeloyl-ACP methyl ester carboxylesterase